MRARARSAAEWHGPRWRDHVSLSLVLPAFNEEETIGQAIEEAIEALARLVKDYEILVVDDGSIDRTFEVAKAHAGHSESVTVLRHAENRGYGAALRTGFSAATKTLVGFTDADCQFDLSELGTLIDLCQRYDIACGYRMQRRDRWHRLLYSRFYNLLTKLLLRVEVRDCDCALKLFGRNLLKELELGSEGFFIDAELLAQARLLERSVVEVGVSHRPRLAGTSTVSVSEALPLLLSLVRFWWSEVLFPGLGAQRLPEPHRTPQLSTGLQFLFLSAFASLFLFSNLSYPLTSPDEARYAEIASNMLASRDYVTPTFGGDPYLDKPPLLYWLIAASERMFGAGAFSARVPSAVSALLTALAVWWLGGPLFGRRTSLLGASLLFLSLGFVISGRFVSMDGPFTFFTTACLLSLGLASRGDGYRSGWLLLAGVAAGLGTLTKGPVILILCLTPWMAAQWLSTKRLPQMRQWLLFLVPAALLPTPWFALMALRDPSFLEYFFWKHHVVRFASAFNHAEPWWFYLVVLPFAMLPLGALLPSLFVFLTKGSKELRRLRSPELGLLLLYSAWVVAFFSASTSKLPTYVFPAIPTLVLLIAGMVEATILGRVLLGGFLEGRLLKRVGLGSAAAVALLSGLDIALEPFPIDWSAYVVGIVALLVLGFSNFGRSPTFLRQWSWCHAATTSLALTAFLSLHLLPEVAYHRSLGATAFSLRATLDLGDAPIVSLGSSRDTGLLFMRNDDIVDYSPGRLEELRSLALGNPRVMLITDPAYAQAIGEAFLGSHSVSNLGEHGHIYLLDRRPPVDSEISVRSPS